MEIKKKYGKIGVLMGGPSTEREISLKSGKAVLESLKKQDLDAVDIDIKSADRRQTSELIRSRSIDCAFVALHGRFGEDGQIQSILEELGLPYSGSRVKASSTAMDKVMAKDLFRKNDLAVAEELVIDRKTFDPAKPVVAGFPKPWVIKPPTHGSSIGMTIVDRDSDVAEAIKTALAYDERALIEEYIEGRELTVGILEDRPLCVIEIIPKKRFFDFEAKYQYGLTEYMVPAKLDPQTAGRAQDMAIAAHKLLGCRGFSRVDIMLDKEQGLYLLEVNTIPGLTSTSLLPKAAKFAGIDFDQLCLKLLKTAYEKE